MINLDEDALICDLAETYHILNYRALPPNMVGVLACGLREDSRIRQKMSGQKRPLDTLILATIADRLGLLLVQNKPGATQKDIPRSIYKTIMDLESGSNSNNMTFKDGAEFEKYRSILLGKANGK